MEKYLKEYDSSAKEASGTISLSEHYSKMADCVGHMIKIVEGRIKE